ncbi:CLC-G [Symbiodinium pilosum]|uniref:Chloride channel protein n=1 Tax=Symbiodinium pilosum TaxID=2952 RepID=A0A812XRV2_SYMPI|nr:CLC-G [Symbiodinium pilosum]
MVSIGSNLSFLLCRHFVQPYVREWVDVSGPGSAQALLVDEQRLAHATRISCTVGGACAIASIFNAPFGGLLYMFEEVTSLAWPLELTFRVFVATMFCSLLSYGLCNLLGSDITEFVIYAETPQDKKWAWGDVPIFVVLAATLGVATSLHTRAMLAVSEWRRGLRAQWRHLQPWAVIVETALYASLTAFLSMLVSFLAACTEEGQSGLEYVALNCPEGQYNPIASLLVATSHSSVKLLFSGNNAGEIHCASSLLAFLTYSSLNIGLAGLPVPGGAFTATMLMGGLFGRFVGALCGDLGLSTTVSGVFAIVGSAAMLCGFKQMTLASVLIVVECVNDLSLAPILMLGVAVSMAVNWAMNERGHDEEVIHRRQLPFLEGEPPRALDSQVALDLCPALPDDAVMPPEATLLQVQRALEHHDVHYFPVRDGLGPCLGIITRSQLETLVSPSRPFASFAAQGEHLFLDTDLPTDEGALLPIHRIMDPTPFAIVEDMPVPRLYALFAKAGERAACVTSIRGDFRGILSRDHLIAAVRKRSNEHPAISIALSLALTRRHTGALLVAGLLLLPLMSELTMFTTMKANATNFAPLTSGELASMVKSHLNLCKDAGVYQDALGDLLAKTAHTTHKNWPETEDASLQLADIIAGPDDPIFKQVFQRVLEGGGWDQAVTAAASRGADSKPWAVLVTGLNGIRKTSSLYEPWFQEVLAEAMGIKSDDPKVVDLPCGANSFFRQLDFMVATLANEDFRKLYTISEVDDYAAAKEAIFARYRKISEMLGLLLVREARKRKVNVMAETSGRDLAMYEYIDFAFPEGYNKLVMHFEINDVEFAEQSVARRMQGEMAAGTGALAQLKSGETPETSAALVAANAGGPYGPEVLRGVQTASDKVFQEVWGPDGKGEGRPGWQMARIQVTASKDGDWTVKAHGSATEHAFSRRP